MKKFNLKLAKEGKQVVTKSGKDAKILYYEREHSHFPLVVIIDNKNVLMYTEEGKFYKDKDSENDLFIK